MPELEEKRGFRLLGFDGFCWKFRLFGNLD